MGLRELCPPGLFPRLQRLAAWRDVTAFDRLQKQLAPDPNGVVLVCPSRESLSGNCEYIARALAGTEFHVHTVLEGDGASRRDILRLMAGCRFTVVDDYCKMLYPLRFIGGRRLMQVWHSTGAFKRMGFARMGRPGSTVATSLTHRNYTDVIVSAPGVVENFCEAFGLPADRIRPIGVPRTDLFFDAGAKAVLTAEFYRRHPELKGKKLVLFAPTFRGETRADAYYPDAFFDPAAFVDALPEDYVLGLKLHPFIRRPMPVPDRVAHRVIDLSAEREINPLLLVAHTLITDYSSVIFEYALLQKPIVFYVPDLATYDRDRSFFYPFETYLYGPAVQQAADLPAAVADARVTPAHQAFFNKFLSACDGQSTARFVELLRKERCE